MQHPSGLHYMRASVVSTKGAKGISLRHNKALDVPAACSRVSKVVLAQAVT